VVEPFSLSFSFHPNASSLLYQAGVGVTVDVLTYTGPEDVAAGAPPVSLLATATADIQQSNHSATVTLTRLQPQQLSETTQLTVVLRTPLLLSVLTLTTTCVSPAVSLRIQQQPPVNASLGVPLSVLPRVLVLGATGLPLLNTTVRASAPNPAVRLRNGLSNATGYFPHLTVVSAPTGCHVLRFTAVNTDGSVAVDSTPVCVLNPLRLRLSRYAPCGLVYPVCLCALCPVCWCVPNVLVCALCVCVCVCSVFVCPMYVPMNV
jgi:hypothetical protein